MVDLAILVIFILGILAGHYRGTIYAAINLGVTVLSLLVALLLIPVASGVVKNSETLYRSMLYYFEGYEYVSATSVERVHDVAANVSESDLDYLIENADMPIPLGSAVKRNIQNAAYRERGIVTLGDYFNQTIVDVIINILSMLVLFIVLRVLLEWILRTIDFALDGMPVMNRFDTAFSCGIGFLHGVLLVYVVFMLVPVALAVVPRLSTYIDESVFGGFFYRVNPLLYLVPTT